MLGGTAEGGKSGRFIAVMDGIVAPMPGSNHPAVKIEDAGKFDPVECDLEAMPDGSRKATTTSLLEVLSK